MEKDVLSIQQAYYDCIKLLWITFKSDLATVQGITSAEDPRWVKICDRYEALVAAAPTELQDYVDSLMKVNIYELEKQWRFNN